MNEGRTETKKKKKSFVSKFQAKDTQLDLLFGLTMVFYF
jgi:hypothetical protein